jgi:hypothetical protein
VDGGTVHAKPLRRMRARDSNTSRQDVDGGVDQRPSYLAPGASDDADIGHARNVDRFSGRSYVPQVPGRAEFIDGCTHQHGSSGVPGKGDELLRRQCRQVSAWPLSRRAVHRAPKLVFDNLARIDFVPE